MSDMPARGAAPLRRPVPPSRSPTNPRRRSVNGAATAPDSSRGNGFASTREELSFDDDEDQDIQNARIGMGSVTQEIDYYALLGVPRDATNHQIRSAYLRLSLSLHPDKQPAELKEVAENHFGKVVRAYEVLSDPRRRIVYDTLGERGLQDNWALGPKAMSQEQFKEWLQDQVRRGKMDLVERLIQSHGEIVISTICPAGMFDQEEYLKKGIILPWTPQVQKFTAKHSFRVGLSSLQSVLDAPLSISALRKGLKDDGPTEELEREESSTRSDFEAPSLHIKTSISMDVHRQQWPSYNLGADLEHEFPPATKKTEYPTLSSLLQNSNVRWFSTILPVQNHGVALSRSFDITHAALTLSTGRSIKETPPAVNLTLTRPLTQRTRLILSGNLAPFYPEFLQPYGLGMKDGKNYRAGTAFAIGLNIQPQLVYSASQSRRAGKPVLKPERSGEKINIMLQSSSNEVASVQLNYSRICFPFGISRDDIPISSDPNAPRPTTRGIELSTNLTLGSLQTPDGSLGWYPMFGMSLTHRITKFTRMGVGYQYNPQAGVVFTVNWSRLGQTIAVPITIGLGPSLYNFTFSFAAPLTVYAATELLYLRPRARREQKRIFKSHLAAIKSYLETSKRRTAEEVALMRDQVAMRQERENAQGGLVVVYAEYGVEKLKGEVARLLAKVDESVSERIVGSGGARVMIDVTVPVANLVQGGQVVVSRKTQKASIVGFYDPVPFERKKVLKIRYYFQRVLHEVTVRENESIVLPLREHAVESTTPSK